MDTIKTRLKQLRIQHDLSMAEFADRIGVSAGNVGDWESEKRKSTPGATALASIATNFDISLDWLILGREKGLDSIQQAEGRINRPLSENESLFEKRGGFFVSEWEESYHFSTTNRKSIREFLTNITNLPDDDIHALNVMASRLLNYANVNTYDQHKKRPPFENKGLTIGEKNLPEHYYVRLPLLGQVPAGDPITAIEQVDEHIDVPIDLVRGAGTYFVLRVKGNSMINANIHDGNLVIVKQQPEAENGEIVVAMTNDEDVTVKTFYKEDNHIRLQPENDTMGPIITREVKILGKVIGVYRLAH